MKPNDRVPNDSPNDERLDRKAASPDEEIRTAETTGEPALRQEVLGPAVEEPESRPGATGIVQQIWRRFKEERKRSTTAAINPRGHNNMDRSKAFLVLATAVILCGFAFLALFSTSSNERRAEERRTTPNLGRPANAAQSEGTAGSTVPLLSADQAAGDQNGDQLSPEDISATSRRAQTPNPRPAKAAPSPNALGQIPPVNDPALEVYRQQLTRNTPPPSLPVVSAPPPPQQPLNTSAGLGKPSLVFVRSVTSAALPGVAQAAVQRTLVERNRTSRLLPTGTRLVARLQAAISSAVKTPVIAVIEYNYERDGQIVVPAGTKAIGQLSQTNQNGDVGLRFTALEMPDGSTEIIDGSGVSLDYGPLRGNVNGKNGVKRTLVRAMTGVGSMAAYLVGGRSYGGLSGPIDQSILLRERIASNVGLAGEQELMRLAYTQNIVITLPGNTRFYIVLQEAASTPAGPDSRPSAAAGPTLNVAGMDGAAVPTAAELRELVALKNELNRMYREVSATRSAVTSAPPQQ